MNRFLNELYPLITGKYIEGKTELDLLSRKAIQHIFKRRAMVALKKYQYPALSGEEKRQIREYYKGYPKVSTLYHRIIKGKTGDFRPEYMPEDLYYGYIEPYFSNHAAARYVDHKCDYYRMFPDVRQPEPVCMRVGKVWLDGNLKPVNHQRVLELLQNEPGEIVLKRAEVSEGGKGVYFLEHKNRLQRFRQLIRTLPCDVVIQKVLDQQEKFRFLHPQSLNTLRVLSLLEPEGVEILSTCVRIGIGESRVDNKYSGGFFVGVKEDGGLRDFGVFRNGTIIKKHPDLGYVIGEQKLPCIEKAHALIKKTHPKIGRFRLVSWDLAVDETGEVNLIEVNLTLGVIDDLQSCNGPVFGNRTQDILKEVFGK